MYIICTFVFFATVLSHGGDDDDDVILHLQAREVVVDHVRVVLHDRHLFEGTLAITNQRDVKLGVRPAGPLLGERLGDASACARLAAVDDQHAQRHERDDPCLCGGCG